MSYSEKIIKILLIVGSSTNAFKGKRPSEKDVSICSNSWHIIFIPFYSTFIHPPGEKGAENVFLGRTQQHNYIWVSGRTRAVSLRAYFSICVTDRLSSQNPFSFKLFFSGLFDGTFELASPGTCCLFCMFSETISLDN